MPQFISKKAFKKLLEEDTRTAEQAKENSRIYMKDVNARKKKDKQTKKFKVSRHPLPMGYGFDLRSGPTLIVVCRNDEI